MSPFSIKLYEFFYRQILFECVWRGRSFNFELRMKCFCFARKKEKPQRYIIYRVSYRYLDPEAVFQLLLFVKTQVTSGGISWSCFITLNKWLCTWTTFSQLLYCLHCYAQFFHQRAKSFWQKTQPGLWSHPAYDV